MSMSSINSSIDDEEACRLLSDLVIHVAFGVLYKRNILVMNGFILENNLCMVSAWFRVASLLCQQVDRMLPQNIGFIWINSS